LHWNDTCGITANDTISHSRDKRQLPLTTPAAASDNDTQSLATGTIIDSLLNSTVSLDDITAIPTDQVTDMTVDISNPNDQLATTDVSNPLMDTTTWDFTMHGETSTEYANVADYDGFSDTSQMLNDLKVRIGALMSRNEYPVVA
jgi:hypothetical protein